MAGFFSRGTMKPLRGWVQINPDHPFSAGFRWGLLFHEGVGFPTLLPGSIPMTRVITGAPAWASNVEGGAYQFPTLNDWVTLTPAQADLDAVSTTVTTILVIRRKLDTTARSSQLFGPNSGGAAVDVGAQVPYSGGTTHWYFGGYSAPNLLSVAGLSYSATIPDRMVFTAGPLGSSIWQNGIKRASQSTAVTRTANPHGGFELNHAQAGSDLIEFNLFHVIDRQWPDSLCQWWSAEPYAHLYTEVQRSYQFLSSSGPTAVEGVGTATGTATVLGVGGYTTGRAKSGFGSQKPSRRRRHR